MSGTCQLGCQGKGIMAAEIETLQHPRKILGYHRPVSMVESEAAHTVVAYSPQTPERLDAEHAIDAVKRVLAAQVDLDARLSKSSDRAVTFDQERARQQQYGTDVRSLRALYFGQVQQQLTGEDFNHALRVMNDFDNIIKASAVCGAPTLKNESLRELPFMLQRAGVDPGDYVLTQAEVEGIVARREPHAALVEAGPQPLRPNHRGIIWRMRHRHGA